MIRKHFELKLQKAKEEAKALAKRQKKSVRVSRIKHHLTMRQERNEYKSGTSSTIDKGKSASYDQL